MISFWMGLGIGIGMVFGVFLAIGLGLLICYIARCIWTLLKTKKYYGF
jgi:hypothetical protein